MGSCPTRSLASSDIVGAKLRANLERDDGITKRIVTDGSYRDVVIVERRFEQCTEAEMEHIEHCRSRMGDGILRAEISPFRNADGTIIGRFWQGTFDISNLITQKRNDKQIVLLESEVRYLLYFLTKVYRELHSIGLNGPNPTLENVFVTQQGLALRNPFFEYTPDMFKFDLDHTKKSWKRIAEVVIRTALLNTESASSPRSSLPVALHKSFKLEYSYSLSAVIDRLLSGSDSKQIDAENLQGFRLSTSTFETYFDQKYTREVRGVTRQPKQTDTLSIQILSSISQFANVGEPLGEATVIVSPKSPYRKEDRAKKANTPKPPFSLEANLLMITNSPIKLHSDKTPTGNQLSSMILNDKDNSKHKTDAPINKTPDKIEQRDNRQQSSTAAIGSKRKQLKAYREKSFLDRMTKVTERLEVDEDRWCDTDYLVDYFYADQQSLDQSQVNYTMPRIAGFGDLPAHLKAFEARRSIDKKREDELFFISQKAHLKLPVIDAQNDGPSILNKFRAF